MKGSYTQNTKWKPVSIQPNLKKNRYLTSDRFLQLYKFWRLTVNSSKSSEKYWPECRQKAFEFCTLRGKGLVFPNWNCPPIRFFSTPCFLVDRSKYMPKKNFQLLFSQYSLNSFYSLRRTLRTWVSFQWSLPKPYHQHLFWGCLMVYIWTKKKILFKEKIKSLTFLLN